jgi:hypothetical protein
MSPLMISYSMIFSFMLVVSRAVYLQDVSAFIIVYHLADVIDCRMRFLWYVMSQLIISSSMILDLYACHRSCFASSGCKSIHHRFYRLAGVIEYRMLLLWYFMSPLMMSYSMIFDVYACHRSWCASSQPVSPFIICCHLVYVIEYRIWFLWYLMSPVMMSYSMMFYVNARHRSCCVSSASKFIHHYPSSWWCHRVSISEVFLWVH